MRTTFLLTSVALTASAVFAQDAPPLTPPSLPVASDVTPPPSFESEPEITLEELLRRAQASNPRLTVAQQNLEAARASGNALRAPLGPTLQLVPGVGGNRNSRDEEIILAQPLDVFGARRARAQVAQAEARRAEAENALATRALDVEVRLTAVALFAAQEAERIETAQVEIARLFREAAAKRAALGDIALVQVQRAELELLRAQNALAVVRTERLTRRTALNVLVGQAPTTPLRVALPLATETTALLALGADAALTTQGTSPLSTPSLGPSSTLSTTPNSPTTSAQAGGALVAPDAGNTATVEARPDLLSAQAGLEAREAQVRAARRARLPQVELQARHAPFVGRSGGATSLRAVVTLPLFDFGALKGQQRAAQAEARAQSATLEVLKQQVAGQRENALLTLQLRRTTVERYRTQIVPLALDLLRKTQIGFAQGASTYLEVLEAQRALRQTQTEYLQALVGAQTSETALDAATRGGLPFDTTLNARGDLR